MLAVHSSSDGFDFSRNRDFGYTGEAFVAQFGDMPPGAGKVLFPVGYKIVRVNVGNGVINEFASNKGKRNVRRGQDITQQDFVRKNNHVLNGQKVFMANCNKCHPGGGGGLGQLVSQDAQNPAMPGL